MTIPPEYLNQIVTGDARELAKRIPDESIDLIFTDPPYPREYLPLYGWLAETAARVLKPGGSLIAMAGQSYIPDILSLMVPHINYHWLDCYSMLGGQAVQIWQRKVITFWKPLIWFVKGSYDGPWAGDVIQSPSNDKRFHFWGQNERGTAAVIERYSTPSALLWEPFTGGGTVPAVCKMLGRNYIAFEIDPDTASKARARVANTQAMHPAFLEEQQVFA